ncbi:MAG TPA: arylesterase [Holophagaceae bacterium]|nr:arylesterase [Holophagaceae bacterium]
MYRMIPLALLFLLACDRRAAAPDAQAQAPAPVAARHTVAFLGDSLTAGLGLPEARAYPALIQKRLAAEGRSWKVLNAGVSGDTTAGGLARLDWLYKQKVDVLVVALGANDGLRGLPLKDTEANLRAILRRGRTEGSKVVLVGMQMPENLGPEYRGDFAALYPRLAKAEGVPFIPFLLEGVALDPALNQADGIHPNEAGARKVAETVWKGIEPLLKD